MVIENSDAAQVAMMVEECYLLLLSLELFGVVCLTCVQEISSRLVLN